MKRHILETVIGLLMLLLIGIYGYALNEQTNFRVRLRVMEQQVALIRGEVDSLKGVIKDQNEGVRREISLNTDSINREIDNLAVRVETRCAAIEKLVLTLIDVLQKNGLSTADQSGGLKNGLSNLYD